MILIKRILNKLLNGKETVCNIAYAAKTQSEENKRKDKISLMKQRYFYGSTPPVHCHKTRIYDDDKVFRLCQSIKLEQYKCNLY